MPLIAHYKLDGDATDSSGNGYNGTTLGVTYTTGKINQSANFVSGSEITTGITSVTLETFSISFWCYYRDFTYPKTFGAIKKSNGTTYEVGIIGWDFGHGYGSDNVNITVNDGIHLVRTNLYFDTGYRPIDLLNKWSHVVFIVNRKDGRVYVSVNGVKQTGYVDISSVTGSISTDNALVIGTLHGWMTDGLIDDVRIYNHALSQKEVKELSRAKVLHYDFDDFQEPTTNLISNTVLSTWPSDSSGHTTKGTVVTDGDSVYITDINSNTRLLIPSPIPITYNNTYTISVKFKKDSGVPSFRWQIQGYNTSNTTIVSYWTNSTSGGYALDADGWQHLYYTFTFTDPLVVSVFIFFQDGADYTGYTHSYWLKDPQLEAKDHATPFVNGSRTGVVRDISGYNNDATLALATTPQWTSDSKIGEGCYKFDPTYNQHISISPSNLTTINGTNSWTLSYWVYVYAGYSYYPFFNKGVSGVTPYGFTVHSNRIEGGDGLGNNFDTTTIIGVFNYNTWTHYAITYDGASIKSYRNGIYYNSLAWTYGFGDTSALTSYIGRFWGPYGKEDIDDVRIYATALNSADILELYQTRAQIDKNGNMFAINFEEADSAAIQTSSSGTLPFESTFFLEDIYN